MPEILPAQSGSRIVAWYQARTSHASHDYYRGDVRWSVILVALLVVAWLTTRYIPNDRIGIVEKLWSTAGSLTEGAVIALHGEAGYQADILRGGLHFGLWRWQYAIHKFPLITIKQGKIGYVFSRGGENSNRRRPWAKSSSATISRTPASSSPTAGKKAGSGASSAKACTPSTSRCST